MGLYAQLAQRTYRSCALQAGFATASPAWVNTTATTLSRKGTCRNSTVQECLADSILSRTAAMRFQMYPSLPTYEHPVTRACSSRSSCLMSLVTLSKTARGCPPQILTASAHWSLHVLVGPVLLRPPAPGILRANVRTAHSK